MYIVVPKLNQTKNNTYVEWIKKKTKPMNTATVNSKTRIHAKIMYLIKEIPEIIAITYIESW